MGFLVLVFRKCVGTYHLILAIHHDHFFSIVYCLVLLCDQNSFGWSKMVLVWPNWFGLDHNDLVMTKMKWSRSKWIGQVQMWFILVENHNLDLTNSFWSWPFHLGWDQIIMIESKSIRSDQNHFGPTKTVLVT